MPVGGEARGDLRVDLGALAGQHQELLDLGSRRAVENRENLLRVVRCARWVAKAQYLQ